MAHPRVGGENSPPRNSRRGVGGSSPRGRGKLADQGLSLDGLGLIPAWAGKTSPVCSSTPPPRAHPRVGGENVEVVERIADRVGSSPRGRGKPYKSISDVSHPRLIPAWAGKTGRRSTRGVRRGAHPRVGGENIGLNAGWERLEGSSPRGRGKPSVSGDGHWFVRLIPAWAGKTQRLNRRATQPQAHPRVGGENARWDTYTWRGVGSSPRGRGKRPAPARRGQGDGLIPAWAGKTAFTRRLACSTRGSSPRGRGKQCRCHARARIRRLIPAWAGKTPCGS